jgi:hypothetical protein
MVIEDMFLYTFKDLDYDFTYRSPQRLEENPWLKNKSPQVYL